MRDVIFRGCSALGVLFGMWWMVSTPVGTTACAESQASRTDPGVIITGCARQTIIDSAAHYGLGIAGGLLIGALLGVLLARLVPVPSSNGTRRDRRARAGVPRAAKHPAPLAAPLPIGVGRWIVARYAGRCATCSSPFRPGDRVRHRPGRVDCVNCWTS